MKEFLIKYKTIIIIILIIAVLYYLFFYRNKIKGIESNYKGIGDSGFGCHCAGTSNPRVFAKECCQK